jgi:8-amino-7-oxononanoate synthase
MNPPLPQASARQTLESRLRAVLRDRESRGLQRRLRAPSGIDFSSNDYLGLAAHPALAEAMSGAVRREGCGSGGSRLLRGHRGLFDEVEQAFAAFKGTERALYFSSGYLANLAVLSTLTERGDRILADRMNHASLRDGGRLSAATTVAVPHNDPIALGRLLDQPAAGHTFVVTESLFSMDGDSPPLAEYAALCARSGATLVVDEAHAVGVFGARGSGLLEAAGVDANAVVSINPAGKALGVSGAFVAGPSWAIEYLLQRARPFLFSTAPPPAVAAALLASLAVIEAEPSRRARLGELTVYLRAALAAAGISTASSQGPIVPVVVGAVERAVAVAAAMQDAGFDIRAIRPPTVPAGTARLRLAVNVSLTEPVIDRAVTTLAATLDRAPSLDPAPWHAVSS